MKTITKLFTGLILMMATTVYSGNPTIEECNDMQAATKIEGKVADKTTGENLAGVLIVIPGTTIKTYTDLDGNFKINGLVPGNYNVSALFISYKTSSIQSVEVNAGESKSINIELQPN